MKTLKNLIYAVALLITSSCNNNPFVVTDNYVVYSEDEYGNGYYLVCKLGCDHDARIEYVKSIEWSKKYLFVQQEKPNQNSQWYIIKAKGNELLCCGRDSLIGPFTVQEVNEYKSNNKITNLKQKQF
ncbi:MAG: hypothetical protein QY303_04440 [Vicingaceae bacterium]|nr:MAG: hypothetical protein QY303_04440 [Vicingaceae bacterium]